MMISESRSEVAPEPCRRDLPFLSRNSRPSEIKDRLDDPIFEDRLCQAVAQAERTGERIALHVLAVDAPATDQLPVEIFLLPLARRIDALVRGCDAVTYLGDRRFVVLQRAAKSQTGVKLLARQLLAAVCAPLPHGDQEFSLGAELGFGLHSMGVDEAGLLRQAESALLKAPERCCGRLPAEGATEDRPKSDWKPKLIRSQLAETAG